MVKIKYSTNMETFVIRLEVSGHAEYAEKGKDIVCSAVSILTYTLAHIIKEMEINERLSEPATIKMDSGDSVIHAVFNDIYSFGKAIHTLQVLVKGYRLLEVRYPEYVKVIEA